MGTKLYSKVFRMMSRIRNDTHAGTWYSSSKRQLTEQIDNWMNNNEVIKGARILVGPHAGYAYCGSVLGKVYGSFDSTNVKRVFIMGPSHHVYFKNCVYLSNNTEFKTPIGNIGIDNETVKALNNSDSRMFKLMNQEMDEDEHCFEMHVPFLVRSLQLNSDYDDDVKIIPIMISSIDKETTNKLIGYLNSYFNDKQNAFIVSTDFCHWGSRFRYQEYSPTGELKDLTKLNKKNQFDNDIPIYKSIEKMDKLAMSLMSDGKTDKYKHFKDYLDVTQNTICGAKPLLVLLKLMENDIANRSVGINWEGYKQSSAVKDYRDSSVSYAGGYAVV